MLCLASDVMRSHKSICSSMCYTLRMDIVFVFQLTCSIYNVLWRRHWHLTSSAILRCWRTVARLCVLAVWMSLPLFIYFLKAIDNLNEHPIEQGSRAIENNIILSTSICCQYSCNSTVWTAGGSRDQRSVNQRSEQ